MYDDLEFFKWVVVPSVVGAIIVSFLAAGILNGIAGFGG